MDFESIPQELRDKACECKTPEDVLSLAKEVGYKLSDEELDSIAGGSIWSPCNSPYYCQAYGSCYGKVI